MMQPVRTLKVMVHYFLLDGTQNQRYNIYRHNEVGYCKANFWWATHDGVKQEYGSRNVKAGEIMCGLYYVNDDTAREIEKLIRQVDEKMRKAENIHLQAGDIHPSEMAPVIATDRNDLCCRWQRWGFPGFNGKQLIFNARSESAHEKKMFKESVAHRRVVVPATWFYEWNKNKEKNIFYREGQTVLYMAGFYNRYQDEDRFVILTTIANESMKPVHDRMPLLLERDEISKWLFEDRLTGNFLQKTPAPLQRRTDYEQMSLFPLENSR